MAAANNGSGKAKEQVGRQRPSPTDWGETYQVSVS